MFHSNVVLFQVKGIEMIGNLDNGSIIGLSDAGKCLVDDINSGNTIDMAGSTDEESLLMETMKKQGYFDKIDSNSLVAAYFHVTNNCNLHCLGCYSLDSTRNNCTEMTYQEACLALDKLSALGAKGIIISGGEPFIRNDIYDIFSYIKEKLHVPGVQVITNGTMTKYYDAEKIAQYVNELNISIDGYSPENPTFIRDPNIYQTVMGNAIALKKAGVNVKLLATLHRKNIEAVGQYIELSKNLDIPLSFSLMTHAGDYEDFETWIPTHDQLFQYGRGGMKGLEEVYAQAKGTDFILSVKRSCGVGNRIISIGCDGTIYPCHMLHRNDIALGNILTNSLEEIRRTCKEFSNMVDVDNISSCADCEYKYLCGGGCRSHALMDNGGLTYEDDYCIMTKTYMDNVFNALLTQINQ
jgi:radical SAM additional 4Fe4S-binding domain